MILSLIKIRFSQIYRGIKDIGLFRAIVLILIIVPILLIFLYNRLRIPNYNYIITGVAIFLVFIIHRRRKDYNFLSKLVKHPALICDVEYLIFSLPLLIVYLIAYQYLPVLIYVIVLLPVSFTIPTPKKNRAFQVIIKYIPYGLFEWQSGFRKNLLPVILFYILGFLGIYKIWFSAISVFLLTMLICSFYSEYEPKKILEASELNASKFIKTKLINHIRCLILFLLPIFIISFIHYEYWLYIILYFLAIVNLMVGAILLKYAYYYPNIVSGAHQTIGSIMLMLSIILPVSILLLFLNIFLYYKSIQNLYNYLNAYN